MGVIIIVTVLAGRANDTDLDRGISGFHQGLVAGEADGVGERVVGRIIRVLFPRAIHFIADFPVLKVTMVGHVGVEHPGSGLVAAARAVVDGNEGLRTQVGGDVPETREAAGPGIGRDRQSSGPGDGQAAGPMILVRERAAGEPQGKDPGLDAGPGKCRSVEIAVPDCGIDAEPARVGSAEGLEASTDKSARAGAGWAVKEISST